MIVILTFCCGKKNKDILISLIIITFYQTHPPANTSIKKGMSAREESEFQIKHKMDRKRVWVPLEKREKKLK